MGTKQYRMKVTLLTATGQTIERPIVLTDRFEADAKYRASRLAPKPGQKVLNVAVVR